VGKEGAVLVIMTVMPGPTCQLLSHRTEKLEHTIEILANTDARK